MIDRASGLQIRRPMPSQRTSRFAGAAHNDGTTGCGSRLKEEPMNLRDSCRCTTGALARSTQVQRLVFKSTHHVANVITVGLATASLCASAAVIDIKTLSTHADRVSGGDVLAQMTLDQSQSVTVTLNGQDVSSAFHAGTTPNALIGLVTGLNLG